VSTLPPVSQEQSSPRTFAAQAVNAARTTTLVNLTMSQMADQKASILMGATFLVFTLTIGQASKGHAPLALLVLGGFAFVSALFAVSVVMPWTGGKHIPSRHANPMFFGVISHYDEDDYIELMLDNLATDETMFRMMFHDVWQNAQVLQNKKYRLLGYAYRSFLAGLLSSAATFILAQTGVLSLQAL
jgi:hypothetical protein